MKKLALICISFIAFAALSCSSISVKHDFDSEANFAALRTFSWIPQPTNQVGNTDAARTRNDLLDKRIKSAVNAELEAKGFSQDSSNPDFLIAYHTGLKDKVGCDQLRLRLLPARALSRIWRRKLRGCSSI